MDKNIFFNEKQKYNPDVITKYNKKKQSRNINYKYTNNFMNSITNKQINKKINCAKDLELPIDNSNNIKNLNNLQNQRTKEEIEFKKKIKYNKKINYNQNNQNNYLLHHEKKKQFQEKTNPNINNIL